MTTNHQTQTNFLEQIGATTLGQIECLGITFRNEAERRAYFLERLRQKLNDPIFRQSAGFPLGETEDILALSDPPWYTACPNPFLTEFVRLYHKPFAPPKPNVIAPYAEELRSTGRHPVYAFHPYHTKVPPEVIRRLIEHYTEPGDLVLDGFCGSGMTGVAAREAGRHAILLDLAPVAGFVSAVNSRSHDWREGVRVMEEIIAASEQKWDYLYLTEENRQKLSVNYYVWSDVFSCPECNYEFAFFPHGVIHHGHKVETRKTFPCPRPGGICPAELNVRRVQRVLDAAGKKRALVWVNAGNGKKRLNRAPDKYDLKLADDLEKLAPPDWFPADAIDPDGYSANLAQLGHKAITDVSRLLSRRNLIVFADLWERVSRLENQSLKILGRAALTSIFTVISERQGYFGGGGGMSGNLYMPIVRMEKNIYASLRRKLAKLIEAEEAKEKLLTQVLVSNQSSTTLAAIPDATIDYIYTDPPFGANIIYSEMNLALEAWLKVKTNNGAEAVVDFSRHRELEQYTALMRQCFSEYYRILKPGHWITIEFHNTSAAIWNLIQTTLAESGFVIAGINLFDKGSTTILADIRPGAAKHDLIISAYKPPTSPVSLETDPQETAENKGQFALEAGTEESAWDFVRRYLAQLPQSSETGLILERTAYRLFDRMVAYHLQQGLKVPISAARFYQGLAQRFVTRDGMYFLEEELEG